MEIRILLWAFLVLLGTSVFIIRRLVNASKTAIAIFIPSYLVALLIYPALILAFSGFLNTYYNAGLHWGHADEGIVGFGFLCCLLGIIMIGYLLVVRHINAKNNI